MGPTEGPSGDICTSLAEAKAAFQAGRTRNEGKRAADHAFLVPFAREMVCSLTGELRGTHDDDYRFGWS